MRQLGKIIFILGALFFLSMTSAYSNIPDSISFQLIRSTYVEGNKSISISLRNKESLPYLIQGSMEALDTNTGITLLNSNTEEIPFIITPPLHKLEGKTRYYWRVIFAGDVSKMPKDRESVYIAKFRAIPTSEVPKEDDNVEHNSELSVVRVMNFKVYYRPKQLEYYRIKEELDKLQFRVENNELIVTNNSPIYMTFEDISVNSIEIDRNETFKPLIPKGEQRFKLKNKSVPSGAKVTWRVLDEFSMPLEQRTTTL
ncbi:molecular chaperone [Providencia stuartii]